MTIPLDKEREVRESIQTILEACQGNLMMLHVMSADRIYGVLCDALAILNDRAALAAEIESRSFTTSDEWQPIPKDKYTLEIWGAGGSGRPAIVVGNTYLYTDHDGYGLFTVSSFAENPKWCTGRFVGSSEFRTVLVSNLTRNEE